MLYVHTWFVYGVLHRKHAGSENDRWFCSSALSSRLQPHGSVAPFLCISWWGKMRQVSALTEGSNGKQTPSCLCCMYERKTIELMGNDERQKLGSNFLLNTKVLIKTKQGFRRTLLSSSNNCLFCSLWIILFTFHCCLVLNCEWLIMAHYCKTKKVYIYRFKVGVTKI